ncbi:hypothetical protein PENSPDRAFT_401882 [Peniophora sp. CONT]|nr:hypothetical protein PENSPDRAFT_401882 [Peniophora sp. CONT]
MMSCPGQPPPAAQALTLSDQRSPPSSPARSLIRPGREAQMNPWRTNMHCTQ